MLPHVVRRRSKMKVVYGPKVTRLERFDDWAYSCGMDQGLMLLIGFVCTLSSILDAFVEDPGLGLWRIPVFCVGTFNLIAGGLLWYQRGGLFGRKPLVGGLNVTRLQRFCFWADRIGLNSALFFLFGVLFTAGAIRDALVEESEMGIMRLPFFFGGIALLGCGGTLWSHRRKAKRRQRFLKEKSPFNHPTLGKLFPDYNGWSSIYLGSVDWLSDRISVPFCEPPIQVSLDDGTVNGPSEKALAGYDWIESNWPEVLRIIEDQAFSFWDTYSIEGAPEFDSPEQIWGTEVVLAVSVSSKDNFHIVMRFTWQTDSDPHEITFYVDDSECETYSVDG